MTSLPNGYDPDWPQPRKDAWAAEGASRMRERPHIVIEAREKPPRFHLEMWGSIAFDGREEWTIKRLLPRKGLAAIYGRPQSFKSFAAFDIAVAVARGMEWAGRRVSQAPVVYIAGEGAEGLRKRKAGMAITNPDIPADLPFALVSAAPNLGAANGDLAELVVSIQATALRPGLIVLDTLAQSLGAGDENGAGMTAFISNASALANRFGCLVMVVHHSGLGDDKRMRGHSSLHGALDAMILCEREQGQFATSLTLQKLKDDASDIGLVAHLERVVIGFDQDGDEVSTLVVCGVESAEPRANAPRERSVPPSQRLLMDVIAEAIGETGESFKPFANDGPTVRGVSDRIVRDRFYSRIAERAEPDEDASKLAARQRQAFNRAIADAVKAKRLVAGQHKGERFIWLP